MKRETTDMGGRRASMRRRSRNTKPASRSASSRSASARSKSRSAQRSKGRSGGAAASARGRGRTAGSASARSTRSRAASARGGGGRGGGAAKSTTDLNKIRNWAESRGGTPVSVKGTARGGSPAGLLRIDFPGYSGAGKFKKVSWDEWYDKFQESNLEFLYQERTSSGQPSRFFKLVCRGTSQPGRSRSSQSPSRRRSRSTTRKR